MLSYTLRRLLLAIPTLIGITMVTFVIVALAPGDPAALKSGEVQDPEQSARMYEMLRKHFELDKPLPVRYGKWLWKTCCLDFGNSFTDGRPVSTKIIERLPASMSLSIIAIVLGFALAVPIGLVQAARAGGWFDQVSGFMLYALFAVPSYVTAILLIWIFGIWLDWLPFAGMTGDNFEELGFFGKIGDLAAHFAIITVCYTYRGLAYDSRFVRQNLLEVMRQDFIRTARSKGATEPRVVLRHALPNTMIPLVTRVGLIFPAIISGSVILEVIFNWPGIGRLFFEAVMARDHPLVMALAVITAALVLIGTLVADLCYALVDPRISYS